MINTFKKATLRFTPDVKDTHFDKDLNREVFYYKDKLMIPLISLNMRYCYCEGEVYSLVGLAKGLKKSKPHKTYKHYYQLYSSPNQMGYYDLKTLVKRDVGFNEVVQPVAYRDLEAYYKNKEVKEKVYDHPFKIIAPHTSLCTLVLEGERIGSFNHNTKLLTIDVEDSLLKLQVNSIDGLGSLEFGEIKDDTDYEYINSMIKKLSSMVVNYEHTVKQQRITELERELAILKGDNITNNIDDLFDDCIL